MLSVGAQQSPGSRRAPVKAARAKGTAPWRMWRSGRGGEGVPPAGVMGGGKAWITGGLGQDATKNRGESDFLYADRATGFIFTRGDRCHRSVTDGEDAPPPFRKREMIPRRRRASSRLKKYPHEIEELTTQTDTGRTGVNSSAARARAVAGGWRPPGRRPAPGVDIMVRDLVTS